jgi:hypothetical protein
MLTKRDDLNVGLIFLGHPVSTYTEGVAMKEKITNVGMVVLSMAIVVSFLRLYLLS